MTTDAANTTSRPNGLPDRYEILGLLGTGGMGRVLHARDQVLDREVAIKVLTAYCALDEAYAQRFLNEARAAARLNHPNIVQIYEFGNQDGCAYLVMEYVDGGSLKENMAVNGRYSEYRAAELIGEACQALGAAHAGGIMHRDVKPDNMMLTTSGAFKLVDLGLAKQIESGADQTMTGCTMGTPHYISPEQIHGDKVVDLRSDIYSLGASLYYLATGSVPFEGSSGAHIMARHLNDPLPDPRSLVPGLSESFCRTVTRAMAKEPAHRHQSTAELAADLAIVRQRAPRLPHHVSADQAEHLDQTIPLAQTPSGAAYCPTFDAPCDSRELQQIENDLAVAIGPLARVLVGRESRHAAGRADLIESLAAHIADREERRRFLKSCGAGDTGSGRLSGSFSGDVSASGSRGVAHPAAAPDPELVAAVTRHLAARIGPVARVLVAREVAAGGGFSVLVERLANHVPDDDERKKFLGEVAHLA